MDDGDDEPAAGVDGKGGADASGTAAETSDDEGDHSASPAAAAEAEEEDGTPKAAGAAARTATPGVLAAEWATWSAAQLRCQALLLLLAALGAPNDLDAANVDMRRAALEAVAFAELEAKAAGKVVGKAAGQAPAAADDEATDAAASAGEEGGEAVGGATSDADDASEGGEGGTSTHGTADGGSASTERDGRLWSLVRLSCAAIAKSATSPSSASALVPLGLPPPSPSAGGRTPPPGALAMLLLAGGAPLHRMFSLGDGSGGDGGGGGSMGGGGGASMAAAGGASSSGGSRLPSLGVAAIEMLLFAQPDAPTLPSVRAVPAHAAGPLARRMLAELSAHAETGTLPRALLTSDLAALPYDPMHALGCLKAAAKAASAAPGAPEPPSLLHAATALVAMRCGQHSDAAAALASLPPRRLLQMCEVHPPLLVFNPCPAAGVGSGNNGGAGGGVGGGVGGGRPSAASATPLAQLLMRLAPYATCDCLCAHVAAGRLPPLEAAKLARLSAGGLERLSVDASLCVLAPSAYSAAGADSGVAFALVAALVAELTGHANPAAAHAAGVASGAGLDLGVGVGGGGGGDTIMASATTSVCVDAVFMALPPAWCRALDALEASAAAAATPLPPLSEWMEAALRSEPPPTSAAPPRSPLHRPRRALCTAMAVLSARAQRRRAPSSAGAHRAARLVAAVPDATWPAAVLCSPSAEEAITLLVGERAPVQAPRAALAYALASQPPSACEASAEARGMWAALLAGLTSSGVTDAAPLRETALAQLADALPPPSFFAVLAAAEVALGPSESDSLRARSLAGSAARSLRAMATSLALEEWSDTAARGEEGDHPYL